MIDSIKLSKLRLSPINVRKRPDDQLQIPQLAADIDARGVLQNLLVTPAKKPRGTFEVFDGGRRLRALMLLAEEGAIDAAAYEVPVKVLQGDEATLTETSTAANFQQLRMTPAEECRAFQHFIGTSGDIDGVAKRFGVTRRFVEGRLRLAALAEPIFTALSEGDITLDMAKAFASTENRDKQLLVWDSYNITYTSADTIRRAISNETMNASDAIAILVGSERYEAEGGRIDRDLFSENGDRWIDPEIAHRLAGQIMEAEAARLGEESGLAWIRPIASSYTHSAAHGLYRVHLPQPELTLEQAERLQAIEVRRGEIEAELQDEELVDEAYDALNSEDDALFAEWQEIDNRAPILPDAYKPLVGLFLTLQPDGAMKLDSCYYSEQPIRTETEAGTGAGDGSEGTSLSGGGGASPTPSLPPENVAPGGKPLSARLYDELAMQRRDILAAALLAEPALALDYAIFCMVDERGYGSEPVGSTIRAGKPQDPISGAVPGSHARDYLAEADDGLNITWKNHKSVIDRFEAFRALDDDSKAAWLAFAVAMSLEAKAGYRNEQVPLHDRLGTILEIDSAHWWRPTSENYFDRIPKASTLALLNEVGGPAIMARHATLKKPEISASCHKLFAGESIVEPEVKEAALAWVPDIMRFRDTAADSVEPADPVEAQDLDAGEWNEEAGQAHTVDETAEEEAVDEAAEAA